MGKKIAVAMSGGVDSSYTALMLKEQGYDVIGITMWLSDYTRDYRKDNNLSEMLPQFVIDAKNVASELGIEHHVLELKHLFKEKVIDYFLDEYSAGRTPNPCVACNRHIKFDALLNQALLLGADYLTTGHYAKVEYYEPAGRYIVRQGNDKSKDQSYVLYSLSQEALSHIKLPLGEHSKTTIRALADKCQLSVASKPESQEICFVPNDDYRAFLRKYGPECLIPGDIVDTKGNVLGKHEGVPLYTIGQRRGLGIAAPEPLYVISLDILNNRVIVGSNHEVFVKSLTAHAVNWLLYSELRQPVELMAKVRYGNRYTKAVVYPIAEDNIRVEFVEPVRAVTPGQSVVFYCDDIVAGGGIID